MVRAVCHDFGLEFEAHVVLYQSSFLEGQFPAENSFFQTVITDSIKDGLIASLTILMHAMLARPVEAAVFIGGMEGIFEEYEIYRREHGEDANVLALGVSGGAARKLAERAKNHDLDRIDFARFAQERLRINHNEPRQLARPNTEHR